MDVKQNGYGADLKNGANGVDSTSNQYICPRCEKTMHADEKYEHDDWHYAKDLQEQDQNGAVAPEPPSQAPPPTHPVDSKRAGDAPMTTHPVDSKQDGNGNSTQPPGYAPPSYPPPASGASRERAIHHHTNQVIEAGKVRARDEVRFASSLM